MSRLLDIAISPNITPLRADPFVDLPHEFLDGLIWARFAADQGYDAIARREVEELGQWLRRLPLAPWYILRAATRQEGRACESLTELGVEHYLPCETVMRRLGRDPPAPHDRPLFPGYLFARLPDELFHAAINAYAVHAVVMTTSATGERRPGRVSSRLVREIREAEERREYDRTIVPEQAPLEVYDTVRVTSGPFAEKVATIFELRAKDRIMLLLGSVFAEVGADQVERAA